MFCSCEGGLHKAHATRDPCGMFARVKRLQSRRQLSVSYTKSVLQSTIDVHAHLRYAFINLSAAIRKL